MSDLGGWGGEGRLIEWLMLLIGRTETGEVMKHKFRSTRFFWQLTILWCSQTGALKRVQVMAVRVVNIFMENLLCTLMQKLK